MNALFLAQLAGQAGQLVDGGREFAAGWIEGRWRYRTAPADPPLSYFDAGTTGRAASQAAVAFYGSLDRRDGF